MNNVERLYSLVCRAAALLPDGPTDGNACQYLEWRELVWQTASSIANIAGDSLLELPVAFDDTFDANSNTVTACNLVRMAQSIYLEMQAEEAARLLSESTATKLFADTFALTKSSDSNAFELPAHHAPQAGRDMREGGAQ